MQFKVFAVLSLAISALGHGSLSHNNLEHQLLAKSYFPNARRSLESCAGPLLSSGTNKRAYDRRANTVNHHRRALSLQKRSLVQILNTSHLHTGAFINPDSPASAFETEHHVLLNPYGDTGL